MCKHLIASFDQELANSRCKLLRYHVPLLGDDDCSELRNDCLIVSFRLPSPPPTFGLARVSRCNGSSNYQVYMYLGRGAATSASLAGNRIVDESVQNWERHGRLGHHETRMWILVKIKMNRQSATRPPKTFGAHQRWAHGRSGKCLPHVGRTRRTQLDAHKV